MKSGCGNQLKNYLNSNITNYIQDNKVANDGVWATEAETLGSV